MRTLTPTSRRRSPRGAACEEAPRLWGEEPRAAAPAPVVAEPIAAVAQVAPVAGTLDELLTVTWAGLTAAAPVACPVCAAAMTPRWSAGAGVVGGRCGGCGSTLE